MGGYRFAIGGMLGPWVWICRYRYKYRYRYRYIDGEESVATRSGDICSCETEGFIQRSTLSLKKLVNGPSNHHAHAIDH